jgi:hypothetical protein
MAMRPDHCGAILVGSKRIARDWAGSILRAEATLHQLSPYIGKIKSSMAASLIRRYSSPGDLVYDPFSGSGTVALEAWAARRRVIANDLSPYAATLTRGKLFPCATLAQAQSDLKALAGVVERAVPGIDLRVVPKSVRDFFHSETLREALAWATVLKRRKQHFLLSCLLGILHHQRPGFLSFPSSHTIPYLRTKRFPRSRFPELYTYRPVGDRLEAKGRRALRRMPALDFTLERQCVSDDAAGFRPSAPVNAIVTSPPYMRQLDYGRDNRLRLWFLGVGESDGLDRVISPGEREFLELMRRCLVCWRDVLAPGGYCVMVLGNVWSRVYGMPLPNAISFMASDEVGGYSLVESCTDSIPDIRRVRRGCRGSLTETVIALTRN